MKIGMLVQEYPSVTYEYCLTSVLDFLTKDNTLTFNLRVLLFYLHGFIYFIEER